MVNPRLFTGDRLFQNRPFPVSLNEGDYLNYLKIRDYLLRFE